LKTAILASPVNIDIARQFMKGSDESEQFTLYYKRGDTYFKQGKDFERKIYNYQKIEMIKDIRREEYKHIILVELPGTNIKLLPYFVILVLFSKAEKISVLLQNGTRVPLTFCLLGRSALHIAVNVIRFFVILPMMVVNLALVIVFSSIVDLIVLIKSKVRS